MNLNIQVDFAPAYELNLSLCVYVNKKLQRASELDKTWFQTVKQKLKPSFGEEIVEEKNGGWNAANFLIWQCPEPRTAERFLHWFEQLSPGMMYELLFPYMPTLPSNLGELRDRLVDLLSEWNEHYFRHVDPSIIQGLHEDAELKRATQSGMSPVEFVEWATNGLRLEPFDGLEKVILIPQYHLRPQNVIENFGSVTTIMYAADAVQGEDDKPPAKLMRITRNLADESRLKILRFLSEKPRTFTEVVKFSGLTKGTVHYHMVALRVTGLVRAHLEGDCASHYSLRTEGFSEMKDLLVSYLQVKPQD